MSQSVVVSPHLDDAFLSLGGLLSSEGRRGFHILNVFTLSNYTRLDSPVDISEITAMRKAEEERNVARVGARVEYWDFPEVLLRGYRTYNDPFESEKEKELVAELTSRLRTRLRNVAAVYFPLAVGRHVDHLILSRIGIELATEGVGPSFEFYEDLPYCAYPETRVTSSLDPWREQPAMVARELEFEARDKLPLCANYISQMTSANCAEIIRYAETRSGHAERVWKLRSGEKSMNP